MIINVAISLDIFANASKARRKKNNIYGYPQYARQKNIIKFFKEIESNKKVHLLDMMPDRNIPRGS
jgi:hypothetical protein